MNPYATHYRRPFAFSAIPYPLIQQVALRLPCLHAEAYRRTVGLTTFPESPTPLARYLPFRACLFWGCAMTTNIQLRRMLPTAYRLVMACQQIWPINPYPDSSGSSHALPMRISLAPQPPFLLAVSGAHPHERTPPLARGFIVRWASNKVVTNLACHRRLLAVVREVAFSPVGTGECDRAIPSLRSQSGILTVGCRSGVRSPAISRRCRSRCVPRGATRASQSKGSTTPHHQQPKLSAASDAMCPVPHGIKRWNRVDRSPMPQGGWIQKNSQASEDVRALCRESRHV